jgi:hypothetical protein
MTPDQRAVLERTEQLIAETIERNEAAIREMRAMAERYDESVRPRGGERRRARGGVERVG